MTGLTKALLEESLDPGIEKYSENQPRDERGRWDAGSGGATSRAERASATASAKSKEIKPGLSNGHAASVKAAQSAHSRAANAHQKAAAIHRNRAARAKARGDKSLALSHSRQAGRHDRAAAQHSSAAQSPRGKVAR